MIPIVAVALISSVAGAQPVAFSRPVPPATSMFRLDESPARRQPPAEQGPMFLNVAGQVVAGTLGAWVGGYLGYAVLSETGQQRVDGDAGYSPNGNTGFALGSFVVSTAAIQVVGHSVGTRSPWQATAIGAAIPTVLLLSERHNGYLPLIGFLLGAPAQAIAGTVGYHVGRQPR